MEQIANSIYFGSTLTIVSFMVANWIKNKLKKDIFNPILIAIAIVITILLVFNIDYDIYNNSAKYVTYLLTPTTICLALPLYRQLEALKKNITAIIVGVTSGVVTSIGATMLISNLLSLSDEQYITLLPKSITTAIGLPLSEELGGIGEITVLVIVVTGIVGNLISSSTMKIFRVKNPIAKGIGIGSASHAIGTVKAMEMGEVEGAMSSLSIAISGILTVIFVQFII